MEAYKKLLKEFISFKSVSTDPQFANEIQNTVRWLKHTFEENGFKVEVINGYDNPLVIASYMQSPDLETCLIYGHYDVQPASKEDGWFNDPFDIYEKDGRLYARGAIDNKGQVLVHIHTVFELIKEKNLKYNVKFLLEGNEETGSPNLAKFLSDHKELLQADFALISDGELTSGHPAIELGFRGIFNSTITVTTSYKDLHSGLYGGAVPNAARELVKILDQIVDENNKIKIDGFYDDVKDISQKSLDYNKQVPFDADEYKNLTGVKKFLTEPEFDFHNQLAFRPSAEITGIQTGYTATGYRNSVPHTAFAKVSFRLTADQDPVKHAKLYQEYVKKITPDYVEVEVVCDQMSVGVILDAENAYVQTARDIQNQVYDKNSLLKYCAATLPIATEFDTILNIPQVQVPLANEDCNMHAANENFDISVLQKALNFSKKYFSK